MAKAALTRGRPAGAKTRFPGIGKAARKLGVNESHLRRVLTGERESKPLMRRYLALKRRAAP